MPTSIFRGGRTGQSTAQNAAAVRESARVNQINERNPFGSVTYTGEIGSPDRTVTTDFSPALTRATNQQQRGMANLAALARARTLQLNRAQTSSDDLAQPRKTWVKNQRVQGNLDFSGAPQLADYADTSGDVERATYERAAALRQPGYEQRRRDMIADLDARGVPLDSQQAQRIMGNMEREQQREDSIAANEAVLAGRGEAERLFRASLSGRQQGVGEEATAGAFANQAAAQRFGQNVKQYDFANQARQAELAERMGIEAHNLQQIQAMMGQQGAISPTTPQTQRAQYNVAPGNQESTPSPLWNLAGTLGSAWIMSSAKRTKDEVGPVEGERALAAIMRTPVQAWRYKGDATPHVGPYADDMAKVGMSDGETLNVGDMAGLNMAALKALTQRVKRLEKA